MRGQKYSAKDKETAIAMLLSGQSIAEVRKITQIPKSTLSEWKTQAFADSELSEQRQKYQDRFVGRTWENIDRANELIGRQLKRAMENENELDTLIAEVMACENITQQQTDHIVKKLRNMKLYDIKAIATTLAQLYDRAQAATDAKNKPESLLDGNDLNVNIRVVT